MDGESASGDDCQKDEPRLPQSSIMFETPPDANEPSTGFHVVPCRMHLGTLITSLRDTLNYFFDIKENADRVSVDPECESTSCGRCTSNKTCRDNDSLEASECSAVNDWDNPLQGKTLVISLPSQKMSPDNSMAMTRENIAGPLNKTELKAPVSNKSALGPESVGHSDASSSVTAVEVGEFVTKVDKLESGEIFSDTDCTNNSRSSDLLPDDEANKGLENSTQNIFLHKENTNSQAKKADERHATVKSISGGCFAVNSPVSGDYLDKFSLNLPHPVSFDGGDQRIGVSSPVTLFLENYESDSDKGDTSEVNNLFLLSSSYSGENDGATSKNLGKKMCKIVIERGYVIYGDDSRAKSLFPPFEVNESGVFLQKHKTSTEKPQTDCTEFRQLPDMKVKFRGETDNAVNLDHKEIASVDALGRDTRDTNEIEEKEKVSSNNPNAIKICPHECLPFVSQNEGEIKSSKLEKVIKDFPSNDRGIQRDGDSEASSQLSNKPEIPVSTQCNDIKHLKKCNLHKGDYWPHSRSCESPFQESNISEVQTLIEKVIATSEKKENGFLPGKPVTEDHKDEKPPVINPDFVDPNNMNLNDSKDIFCDFFKDIDKGETSSNDCEHVSASKAKEHNDSSDTERLIVIRGMGDHHYLPNHLTSERGRCLEVTGVTNSFTIEQDHSPQTESYNIQCTHNENILSSTNISDPSADNFSMYSILCNFFFGDGDPIPKSNRKKRKFKKENNSTAERVVDREREEPPNGSEEQPHMTPNIPEDNPNGHRHRVPNNHSTSSGSNNYFQLSHDTVYSRPYPKRPISKKTRSLEARRLSNSSTTKKGHSPQAEKNNTQRYLNLSYADLFDAHARNCPTYSYIRSNVRPGFASYQTVPTIPASYVTQRVSAVDQNLYPQFYSDATAYSPYYYYVHPEHRMYSSPPIRRSQVAYNPPMAGHSQTPNLQS